MEEQEKTTEKRQDVEGHAVRYGRRRIRRSEEPKPEGEQQESEDDVEAHRSKKVR